MNADAETPLGDSVNDVDLSTKNPDPSGDDKKPDDEQLTAEELAAIAGDDDDVDRDDKGRFVPRARVDELTAQRNAERDRAAAAEAKAAELQAQRDADAEAARVAAEKAKELRDFEAERDALQAKFDDSANGMDLAEYNKQMRALDRAEREQDRRVIKEEAIAEMEAREEKKREQIQTQTLAEAEKSATEAAERFIADPENVAYKDDVARIAMLNKFREIVWTEKNGNIGWDDLLTEAKARVEAYLKPKAADETPEEKTRRERREAGARANAAAAALPGRPEGGQGARGTNQGKDDDEELSREEWDKLPKAERDRRLGRTS